MKKLISTLVAGLLFFGSCGSDKILDEPEIDPKPIPQEYELVSIQFTPDPTGFKTIPGEPEIFKFSNHGNVVRTDTYQCQRKRMETSLFYAPEEGLPKDSNISGVLANVPDIDGEPKVIGMTVPKFKFSFDTEQVYRQEIPWVVQTVNIAPLSSVVVTECFIGFELEATYHAVLENIHSGQRIELTGKWKGMKQNNEETVLKEDIL